MALKLLVNFINKLIIYSINIFIILNKNDIFNKFFNKKLQNQFILKLSLKPEIFFYNIKSLHRK